MNVQTSLIEFVPVVKLECTICPCKRFCFYILICIEDKEDTSKKLYEAMKEIWSNFDFLMLKSCLSCLVKKKYALRKFGGWLTEEDYDPSWDRKVTTERDELGYSSTLYDEKGRRIPFQKYFVTDLTTKFIYNFSKEEIKRYGYEKFVKKFVWCKNFFK